jgi:hypothetical protein
MGRESSDPTAQSNYKGEFIELSLSLVPSLSTRLSGKHKNCEEGEKKLSSTIGTNFLTVSIKQDRKLSAL